MRDTDAIMKQAGEYVDAHLLELCEELVYLWDIGFLPSLDCHTLELRAILETFTFNYCALAERMVTKASIRAFINNSDSLAGRVIVKA